MADEQELTPEEKLLQVIQKGESKVETDPGSEPGRKPETDASVVLRRSRGSVAAVSMTNRILAIAAALLVLLAGYESWLQLPQEGPLYAPENLDLNKTSLSMVTASLSDSLDQFARRRIFGVPPPREDPELQGVPTTTLIGWRAYARENLRLMGMSEIKQDTGGAGRTTMEAIVMDNQIKKMHFLQEGQALVIAEQEITVSRIGDSSLELRQGEELLTIE